MAPKHCKTSILGAVIVSEKGFLEAHSFPERRVVGLLLVCQSEGGFRNTWPAALSLRGTLTGIWHFACYCDLSLEDCSAIARTPPSEHSSFH